MRTVWLVSSLICVLAIQLPCVAQSSMKWSFQRTGFRSSTGSTPQTALSMRSNLSWPVVYGVDQGMLNAYSLFPVPNSGQPPIPVSPATNWHQIGTNLTGSPLPGSSFFLQADSGFPDGFAVSLQSPTPSQLPTDAVVVGNSTAGFQPPQIGAQAVKFDDNGNPLIATNAILPGLSSSQKLFDVAISPFGDVGAVTQGFSGGGPITFWQRSPLLEGNWLSTNLSLDGRTGESLFGPTVDLTFDAASRPHVVGINHVSPRNNVAAFRFDVTTGAWTSSILDTGGINSPPIVDVAAASNDDGIVGAAWVNGGTLKYAYLDTNEASPTWVVTTVANSTPTGMQLEMSQGVGLAFDKAGLPVISFVDRTMRQIWIAYDPPSAFGGGITDQPSAEGDFNGDGIVDGYDLDAWGAAFGEDGLDGNDFLAWQRNAIPAAPAAAAAVPEPLALASGLVGAALLLGSTRKNRR